MRTPRLFLGIFALAMLLPLLLLACGGSDEPRDGPSSERATVALTRAQTSPETDREALVALYNATGGPNWDNNRNWLSDVPISEWSGVTADGNGRVTELVPFPDGLVDTGKSPPTPDSRASGNDGQVKRVSGIRHIQVETVLDLGGNKLSGELRPELGNLTNLTVLYLNVNRGLRGKIPPELGNLANLTRLGLSGTRLSGEIPPELGNLASLTRLHIGETQLSGEIPPELGNLANLSELTLSSNQLSGEIPPELGNLANLSTLALSGNQLSGEIPPELGNLASLEDLYLGDNQLSGEVPPELGNLANLTRLSLHDNQLSGCVPRSFLNQLHSTSGLRLCP